MYYSYHFALFCIALAWQGLAFGQTEDTAKGFIAKYQEFFNRGDLDGVMSLYLPDAVLMPTDESAQVGTKQIRSFMNGIFQRWTHELTFEPVEVEVFGDRAILRLEITGRSTAKDGSGQQPINNKGLIILRHDHEGAWKFWRYRFNANVPSSTS